MTTPVLGSLQRLARDLDLAGARWALIGGFAVSARCEPRFTRDVDVCVVASADAEAEHLARALMARGYGVESLIEHETMHRLATLRLISPVPGGVVVDLLFASSGIEAEIVAAAEPLEIVPGLVVPVARVASLIVLKLLARDEVARPQDGIDLRSLRPVLAVADESEVRRLAGLVGERGFDRGRDLPALVEAYLAPPPCTNLC